MIYCQIERSGLPPFTTKMHSVRGSRTRVQLRSPILMPSNTSAPPSSMRGNLFPVKWECQFSGNGSVSFHPVPLPPGAMSPMQTGFSDQLTPKVEMPSVAGQWQKGRLLGSGTVGCVYEATTMHTGALCAMKEVDIIPDDAKSTESLKQLEQGTTTTKTIF